MKVNFDYAFLDDAGKPVSLAGQPATMKSCTIHALLHAKAEGEEGEPSAQKKRHRYGLAARISNHGSNTELAAGDVELIRSVIGAHHVLVCGPAMDLLEGNEPEKMAPKLTEVPKD
jgi:hypothetical protein